MAIESIFEDLSEKICLKLLDKYKFKKTIEGRGRFSFGYELINLKTGKTVENNMKEEAMKWSYFGLQDNRQYFLYVVVPKTQGTKVHALTAYFSGKIEMPIENKKSGGWIYPDEAERNKRYFRKHGKALILNPKEYSEYSFSNYHDLRCFLSLNDEACSKKGNINEKIDLDRCDFTIRNFLSQPVQKKFKIDEKGRIDFAKDVYEKLMSIKNL
ncbi:MAG: hypothetical protein V1886_00410 [archaeon]